MSLLHIYCTCIIAAGHGESSKHNLLYILYIVCGEIKMEKILVILLLLCMILHNNSFRHNLFRLQKINEKTKQALYAGFGQSSSSSKPKTNIPSANDPCACTSGKTYGDCCKEYHDGTKIATHPVAVVRSRFSGLSYGLVPYLMSTTHPSHKDYVEVEQTGKKKAWVKDLQSFCERYKFLSIAFDDEEAGMNPVGDEVY